MDACIIHTHIPSMQEECCTGVLAERMSVCLSETQVRVLTSTPSANDHHEQPLGTYIIHLITDPRALKYTFDGRLHTEQ